MGKQLLQMETARKMPFLLYSLYILEIACANGEISSQSPLRAQIELKAVARTRIGMLGSF